MNRKTFEQWDNRSIDMATSKGLISVQLNIAIYRGKNDFDYFVTLIGTEQVSNDEQKNMWKSFKEFLVEHGFHDHKKKQDSQPLGQKLLVKRND